jgi:hypothetical protein
MAVRTTGPRGPRPQFSDRYYAANLLDPDGYSLEICFKPWQYDGSDPVSSRAQRQTN